MTHYHPLQNAARAAWGELTTDEALTWYQDKAWTDLLSTYAIARQLCLLTIHLGAIARLWCDTFVPTIEQPSEKQQALLPQRAIAGYLPEFSNVKRSEKHQALLPQRAIAGYLPEFSSAKREVLVTPPPVDEAPLVVIPTGETIEVDLEAMTIRQLKTLARKAAIRGYGQMNKVELLRTISSDKPVGDAGNSSSQSVKPVVRDNFTGSTKTITGTSRQKPRTAMV
jgi:hypothetical protein